MKKVFYPIKASVESEGHKKAMEDFYETYPRPESDYSVKDLFKIGDDLFYYIKRMCIKHLGAVSVKRIQDKDNFMNPDKIVLRFADGSKYEFDLDYQHDLFAIDELGGLMAAYDILESLADDLGIKYNTNDDMNDPTLYGRD